MARAFAGAFYQSAAWIKTSRAFMQSKAYICERCGGVATVAHHKKYLNAQNINDPAITLNWANLEALCYDCHAAEHTLKKNKCYFDEAGNIERVKDSGSIADYRRAAESLSKAIEKLTAQEAAGATKTT